MILKTRIIQPILVILISITISCLLLMWRIPGMELVGVTPNWLLIWLVVWSVKRNLWQSMVAAVSLGLIWDSISGDFPTHVLGLAVIALLTSNVYQGEYIKEDVISIVVIVFGMVIISDTVTALQYSLQTNLPLRDIWLKYQQHSLASAIISSLWTPLLYYPFNHFINPSKKSRRP
ncbi:rod shape-determining protein MreD [Cyanobacterium stanieri LEGE 03274]|uniref:Rod shape-determining protein MreD n=1 Tax=Cyanobacterium stanieri LEGE 03274 TaxID=1828756 RepID=A0ABR9V1E8_9CHRO|nr:rod shape-determining protein MreD [Cyanobacterium stanieri]MBE9221371.1 rod shape-determining protein MreD [Cyanobacterium stanieri LEGE 03274]